MEGDYLLFSQFEKIKRPRISIWNSRLPRGARLSSHPGYLIDRARPYVKPGSLDCAAGRSRRTMEATGRFARDDTHHEVRLGMGHGGSRVY